MRDVDEKKSTEMGQCYTHANPSEGWDAQAINTFLTLPIYILKSANYEPVMDSSTFPISPGINIHT